MKWPRTLRIYGETWKVKLVSKQAFIDSWGQAVLGDADSGTRTIRVWRGLKNEARYQTLLHEILHIASWRTFGETGISGSLEEHIISNVDVHLFHILNRNFGFGK